MKRRWAGTIACVLSAFGPVAACGASAGSGAATSASSACDQLFTLIYGAMCLSPRAPAAEIARLRPRFDEICTNGLELPGVTLTGAQLDACVAAYHAPGDALQTACTFGVEPQQCLVPGTRADGASCSTDLQCQSDHCSLSTGKSAADGGQPTCGTCQPTIAVGQPCGGTSGACAPGSTCVDASSPPTCVGVGTGDVGAPCDPFSSVCSVGLFCDSRSTTCQPQTGAGAACTIGSNGCTPPLTCIFSATGSSCQSAGPAGAPCTDDADCAAPLGCALGACATIDWAAGGQPCGGTTRCLVGSCLSAQPGAAVCPTVIADGQPCVPDALGSTCDTFASCSGGVCTLLSTGTCN